jgi:hypothetical protein
MLGLYVVGEIIEEVTAYEEPAPTNTMEENVVSHITH